MYVANVENVVFDVVVGVGHDANKRDDVVFWFVLGVPFCQGYIWQIRGTSGKRQELSYILYNCMRLKRK